MIQAAIIGFGQRGKATFERLQYIKNVEVTMLCDTNVQAFDALAPAQKRDVLFTSDYHQVTEAPSLILIYICTPWDMHVNIAVEAMNHGKHVAIEVPAAMTVKECEQLVCVSRQTGRHCVMLENCCYDTWHLGVREMVRRGLFGRITHLEGAYIHPVEKHWMQQQRMEHAGNPYPTHGLGPMCQLLDEDDRLEVLMSMSSQTPEACYRINNTLLQTRKGVSMLLQYDTSTPRPYSRLQTVCGTEGFAQKYPLPTVHIHAPSGNVASDVPYSGAAVITADVALCGEEAMSLVESFIPPQFRQLIEEGNRLGVSNIMNYMMDRRLIDGLQSGHPRLDMEVHEAALWSSITELTEQSVRQGGKKIPIPMF